MPNDFLGNSFTERLKTALAAKEGDFLMTCDGISEIPGRVVRELGRMTPVQMAFLVIKQVLVEDLSRKTLIIKEEYRIVESSSLFVANDPIRVVAVNKRLMSLRPLENEIVLWDQMLTHILYQDERFMPVSNTIAVVDDGLVLEVELNCVNIRGPHLFPASVDRGGGIPFPL